MVKTLNAFQTNYTSNLVYKANFDTEIKEVENKIADYNKYIVNNDFDKFSNALFHELATTIDVNTVEQRAITIEKKREKLKILDLNLFLIVIKCYW